MIEIKNLSKKYQTEDKVVTALDNINLEIPAGEIFGVIGPSGAGKSTFIRCLNLLEEPTSGQVLISGQDITKLSNKKLRQQRKKIGMIFQGFNLLKSRTVAENVAFPLEISGKKQVATDKVTSLLKLVGLADKADSYPAQLSGGQQQRVGIARALANDPEVLLCDEATSSLDPETTASILKLLEEIKQKLGLTIVLITHEMEVIKQICSTVAVLEAGKVVEHDKILNIFTAPKAEVTKKFVEKVVNSKLPEDFLEQQKSLISKTAKLIKVSFIGQITNQPIISELIHKYQIRANILHGNIDQIQGQSFGTLMIELNGNNSAVEEAINSLITKKDIKIEVIDNGTSTRNIS